MGRFSSALTSLYGRDSDVWESKAPAVNVLGRPAIGSTEPEAEERKPQDELEEEPQQEAVEEAVALTTSVEDEAGSTEAYFEMASDNEASEPLQEEAPQEEAPQEEQAQEEQAYEEQSHEEQSHEETAAHEEQSQTPEQPAEPRDTETVEAAAEEEEEPVDYTLPQMFQPNPKGMQELRTQLGIITKEDREGIAGGDAASSISAADQTGDESEAVLNLVQQVLGIAPEVRLDGDDGTTGQLETIEDELINDQINAAAEEAAASASENQIEQPAAVEETVAEPTAPSQAATEEQPDSKTDLDSQVAKVAAMLAPTAGVAAAAATGAASSVFQPVMETWADVSESTEVDQSPVTADQTPPLSNPTAPPADQSTRHPEGLGGDVSQEILFAPETSSAPGAIDSSGAEAAAAAVDSASNFADPSETEASFEFSVNDDAQEEIVEAPEAVAAPPQEPVVEEAPPAQPVEQSELDVPALNTQSWSPALGALAKLQDKVEPSDFERTMAERLLETEFGQHIQGMSDRISQSTQGPAVLFFLSLEPTVQQTDVVAGLAMYICAQREAPTLLMDANCNQKTLSRRIGNIGEGLIEASDDTKPWYESVAATSCDRLRFLRVGNSELDSSNLDDLRGSIRYMLSDLKDSFGLVLIDGGSIDSKLVPVFADLADATFLTVELGSDEREGLAWATEQLAEFGANLKGCITTGPTS